MMEYTIIKLNNLSPLHIGIGREAKDFSSSALQSDTLVSALASVRAQCGKSENMFDFINSFTLSSAFPFYKDEYFLPKPMGKLNISVKGHEEKEYRKSLKKIKFIEYSLWERIIHGEENIEIDIQQINGEFLCKTPNQKKFMQTYVSERAAVGNEETETKPFYFEWKYFDKDAGLFCLTDAKQECLDEIIYLFDILSENGIGTDRNVGGGKFTISTDKITINPPQNANQQMALSMYLPNEDECNKLPLSSSKYAIEKRGGFISGSEIEEYRHFRKNSVYMFLPGSVFNTTENLCGDIVDLRPQYNNNNIHNVFRSGKSFFIPIKIQDNE